MRLVLSAVLALGCGPPPAPAAGGAIVAQPPARKIVAAPATQAARSPGATLPITLVPLESASPPGPVPRLEVLQPSYGDTLDPRFARKQPVRLRADAAWLTADGQGVLVSLDGARPRRVLGDSALALGDLLPMDQALTEGPHVLLALAIAADGRALRVPPGAAIRPLSVVGFFVGARTGDPPSTSSPQLFCLNPVGTQYLKPGAALPFEVLAVGWEPRTLDLRVHAHGAKFETSIDPSRSYAVNGVPVGDVVFSVGGAPGPRAECVVTVNPETAERAP